MKNPSGPYTALLQNGAGSVNPVHFTVESNMTQATPDTVLKALMKHLKETKAPLANERPLILSAGHHIYLGGGNYGIGWQVKDPVQMMRRKA